MLASRLLHWRDARGGAPPSVGNVTLGAAGVPGRLPGRPGDDVVHDQVDWDVPRPQPIQQAEPFHLHDAVQGGLAVTKRLRLEGFIVSDHFDLMPGFVEQMAEWVAEGRVKWRQTVDEGIESAPGAFLKLFSGGNVGKMLVRLAD